MEGKPETQPEEIRIIDGKRFRKVFSGYTVRQYYSHHTPDKGPGPGWDRFNMDPQGTAEKYGITKNPLTLTPQDLPDEPLYEWEEIEE